MRHTNPLHFLTERQIKLLAQAEGLSVPQLLAKYDRLRVKASKTKRPAKKASSRAPRQVSRGQTRLNPSSDAAEAMRLYHSGEAASLQDAWNMLRGGRPRRPKKQGFVDRADALVRTGRASSLSSAMKTLIAAEPPSDGARAMHLFRSGRASSLREAWRMVKAERR